MDTKKRVIVESYNLFKLYGIRSITMDFIAEKLGISKRTIYELFQSKDELLNECIIYAMEIERKETKEIIENSENMIEAFLKNIKLRIRKMNLVSPLFIIDAKKYHFEVFNNKMREQDEVTYKSFVNFIKEGKEKGYFNPEINEEIVSKLNYLNKGYKSLQACHPSLCLQDLYNTLSLNSTNTIEAMTTVALVLASVLLQC